MPAEVKRFDQVKVGDKPDPLSRVIVFQVRKPGEASNKPGDSATASRTPGVKPGAQMAGLTATVDVVAVDPSVPRSRSRPRRRTATQVEDGRTSRRCRG